jgi:hypothetical protein
MLPEASERNDTRIRQSDNGCTLGVWGGLARLHGAHDEFCAGVLPVLVSLYSRSTNLPIVSGPSAL